jgi:hypothetical protein
LARVAALPALLLQGRRLRVGVRLPAAEPADVVAVERAQRSGGTRHGRHQRKGHEATGHRRREPEGRRLRELEQLASCCRGLLVVQDVVSVKLVDVVPALLVIQRKVHVLLPSRRPTSCCCLAQSSLPRRRFEDEDEL